MGDELWLLLPPFAAGSLVLLSHLPLGLQVLKRRILFIDLAIAQLAALGGLLAHWLGSHSDATMQTGGSVLAIGSAIIIGWLAHAFPAHKEAFIGLIYACAAALLLLLVSADPHGHQHLTRSLSGDVLWVEFGDILPLAGLTVVLFACLIWQPQLLDGALFYPVFALFVSLSVPLLGIYLVFSTLIAPALLARKTHYCWGGLAGVAGYMSGLALAWHYDTPTGATLVITLILLCGAALPCLHLWNRFKLKG